MTRWEYKLIHLNVAPSSGASVSTQGSGSSSSSPSPTSSQSASVFSQAYLEQEFPGFYSHSSGGGQAAQSTNPVLQLQGFLNAQGQDRWCLIGLYNVGPLLLMVFRRRLADQPPAPPAAVQEPVLSEILQRLQRLELGQKSSPRSAPTRAVTSEEAWVLAEDRYRSLSRDSLCTAAEASRRLGFRSTVSLHSFVRRHGYVPGLVKVGASGWAAVYDGELSIGGRRRHSWLLVKASDLRGQ